MPVPLPSGFKSKEEYAAYMREYRKRKKRRKEFAKQRIIQFLKLIGKFDDEFIKLISDSEFKGKSELRSLDDCIYLLNRIFLPQYWDALLKNKRNTVFFEELYSILESFADIHSRNILVRWPAYYFTSSLSHIDESFVAISSWLKALQDYVLSGSEFAEEFNKKREAECFKKVVEILKEKKTKEIEPKRFPVVKLLAELRRKKKHDNNRRSGKGNA